MGNVYFAYCLLTVFSLVSGEPKTLSVLRSGRWKHKFVEGTHPEAALTASFNNTVNDTGWSFLEIHSREGVPDEEVAFLAGVMEGRLTGQLIQMQWTNTLGNYCAVPSQYCTKLADFLTANDIFIEEQISQKKPVSPYWYQIFLFKKQIEGLQEGYSQLGLKALPKHAFLYFQLHGDLDSLEEALGEPPHHLGSGSCSALVKVLPGTTDLLIGHTTWTSYYNMLRIYKLYDLKYGYSQSNGSIIPGYKVSFSSYPGRLYSGDDFYISSSGLLAMETTIGNYNSNLWKYVTPDSVLENFRAMVANRLATSGQEWSSIFSQFNSGTYNNEWMIVDLKLFIKGKLLTDGMFWVLNQIPGTIMSKDQTDILRNMSYWASYNIPSYPEIFNKSGFAALVEKYGNYFSHDGCPRAEIFARNQSSVIDLDTMMKLIKYNNFQHDPLSRCNCNPPYSGENAISARCDLNPANGTYPISFLGHRYHGGIDMKATTAELALELSSEAESGPSHDQLPAFQWSTSGFHPKPLGHPDKWNFKPVSIKWKN